MATAGQLLSLSTLVCTSPSTLMGNIAVHSAVSAHRCPVCLPLHSSVYSVVHCPPLLHRCQFYIDDTLMLLPSLSTVLSTTINVYTSGILSTAVTFSVGQQCGQCKNSTDVPRPVGIPPVYGPVFPVANCPYWQYKLYKDPQNSKIFLRKDTMRTTCLQRREFF